MASAEREPVIAGGPGTDPLPGSQGSEVSLKLKAFLFFGRSAMRHKFGHFNRATPYARVVYVCHRRVSVCLSHSVIVSEQLNVASRK